MSKQESKQAEKVARASATNAELVGEMTLLTTAEVAQILRVDVRTIRNRIKAGELHPLSVGGAYRWTKQMVANYLAECRTAKEEQDDETDS